MAGEKTEQATPKRKQDERKKGNIFLSKEVVTIVTLLLSFYSLKFLMPNMLETISQFIQKYIALGVTQIELTSNDMPDLFIDCCIVFAATAMPILVISVLGNVIITMAQTKLLVSPKAFAFKMEKLNPLKGLKKMVSLRSLVELFKSLLKIMLLIYIIYSVVIDEIGVLPKLMYMQPMEVMVYTGDVIMQIALKCGIAFIFLGAGDYLYQWWEYRKNMRMSKQDIKDEYKQMEGDPKVKGQIRAIQQQMARQRMMQNVPDADVVIRNPTHYAVAIKYDRENHHAPMVVAKGANEVALRIIAIAEENGVHVTENRPLARALFETVEIDSAIPSEHYQAIAEILAFIYSLKKKDLK